MSFSFQDYPDVPAGKIDYSFNFVGQEGTKKYIRKSDIIVEIDDVDYPDFELTSDSTLQLTGTPPSGGELVRIRRVMPDIQPYANFTTGNSFSQENVNSTNLQMLYLIHQLLDGFLPDDYYLKDDLDLNNHKILNYLGDLDLNGGRLSGLLPAVEADDAVTLEQLSQSANEFISLRYRTVLTGDTSFINLNFTVNAALPNFLLFADGVYQYDAFACDESGILVTSGETNYVNLGSTFPSGTDIYVVAAVSALVSQVADFSFDTVADMTAATIPVGRKVETKGYYAAGDGGGASYLCVAGNTGDGYVNHDVGANTLVLQTPDLFNLKQCGVSEDIADNRTAIQAALDYCSAIEGTLASPSGSYDVEADADGTVLVGKSNTRIIFEPGSKWVLKNTGGHDVTEFLGNLMIENVTYDNIRLDAGNVVGANVFGAAGVYNITINGGEFMNGIRSATTGGGRGITFQSYCQNIRINHPYVHDCTTGLDFHGRHYLDQRIFNCVVTSPVIEDCEEAISFYQLFDGNTDLGTGGDNQVVIMGGSAHNCGLATDDLVVGGVATGEEGGVIVCEQARSMTIDGFTVFNDAGYGKIGGVFRGTFRDCKIANIVAFADVVAVVNLSPADNTLPVTPSTTSLLTRASFDVTFMGSCDYVVYHDTGAGTGQMNMCQFKFLVSPPATGILNSLAAAAPANSFIEARSASNGNIIRGFVDTVYADTNAFLSTYEVIESHKTTKRKPLHINTTSTLDQLKLERTGTNPGTGRIHASSGGMSLADNSYNDMVLLRTMDGTRDVRLPTNTWNLNRLVLNGYYFWVDATGDFRIKNGAPSSDTDGTVVGTQS